MKRRIVLGSLVGFGLGLLLSCSEVRGVAGSGALVSSETGGIDQVRLGFGLGPDGRVSRGCTARGFAAGDPIHLSLQVTDAQEGALLVVTIRDAATLRPAWSEQRAVPAGRSVQTFDIGRGLGAGRYRAEPAFHAVVVSREFDVHPPRDRTPG